MAGGVVMFCVLTTTNPEVSMAIWTALQAKNEKGQKCLALSYQNLLNGETYKCGTASPKAKVAEVVDHCFGEGGVGAPGDVLFMGGMLIQCHKATTDRRINRNSDIIPNVEGASA